jgi:hypothetical protein
MEIPSHEGPATRPETKRRYVRAVGPRLRLVLNLVWGLLALLGANSVYLLTVTFMTWLERDRGVSYQNYFYQLQFLGHLVIGLLFVIPFLAFNVVHIRNTWNRPNRKAVYVGYALFAISLVVLVSGVVLVRFDGLEFLRVKSEGGRSAAYWAHVVAPLLCIWLYILHRLAGPRIRWNVGIGWGGAVAAVVADADAAVVPVAGVPAVVAAAPEAAAAPPSGLVGVSGRAAAALLGRAA